jgi:hypothetical protein
MYILGINLTTELCVRCKYAAIPMNITCGSWWSKLKS